MTIITEYHNGLKVCGKGDLHEAIGRALTALLSVLFIIMLQSTNCQAQTENEQARKSKNYLQGEILVLSEAEREIKRQASTLQCMYDDDAPTELVAGILEWINGKRADNIRKRIAKSECSTI